MRPAAGFELLATDPWRERFVIHHPAQGLPRGQVVHVHPFGEELNKTRRMVSEQARQLAASGFDVVLVDLFGCGDSPGRFEDASWDGWVADMVAAAGWLAARRAGSGLPLWLWGTRAGALLAAAAAVVCKPEGLLLWQPVVDGDRHLLQFLRIADAQLAMRRPEASSSADLLSQLVSGTAVDVAGYRLTPAVALGLRQSKLDLQALPVRQVLWIEQAATRAGLAGAPGPASSTASLAVAVLRFAASGAAFWYQADAEDAPDWWDVTLRAMAGTAA